MKKFEEIREQFKLKINNVNNHQSLKELKVEFFGKKGLITGLMSEMKNIEDKKSYGQAINDLKCELMAQYNIVEQEINEVLLNEQLKKDAIDVTLPGRKNKPAKQNILLKTAREIEMIFIEMGYEIAIGPEVETDFYNFEALNLDKNHPARDMQDTFYINEHLLLRTHTSGIQSRTLQANANKDLKIICPGKVYRRDDDDATHSHQFMQIEGLVVINKKQNISASMRELKTTLSIFANKIFAGEDLEVRFRQSFFPFTEPSVEVDITCSRCKGSGCNFCKQTGFIEVLGAGVIHKNVLKIAGYDEDEYVGFAFGIGVERIALLKHNIDDIRHLYINDERFNKQF